MAKAKSRSARPAAAPKGRTTAKGPAKTAARNVGPADAGPARPSAKEAAAKAVSKPAAPGDKPDRAAKVDKPAPGEPAENAERDLDTVGRGAKKAAAADASGRAKPAPTKRTAPSPSSRYTPPVPKSEKVSPIWVPILMFTCLGLGMLIIILNYVNVLPGPDPSNVYLMIGLGLITVGFITATKFH